MPLVLASLVVIRLSRERLENQVSVPVGAEISLSSSRLRSALCSPQPLVHLVPGSPFSEVNLPASVTDHCPLPGVETIPLREDQGAQKAVLQILYFLSFYLRLSNTTNAAFRNIAYSLD